VNAPIERRRRWGVAALITALAAAIVVVVVIGVVSAAAPLHRTNGAGPTASTTASASGSATAKPSTSPVASTPARTGPTVVALPAATPQPTRTATISHPTAIVKALTAKVTRMEAVTGTAEGPGEIGGPSVRFTITITNTTGATVDLSNTVVNAYFGAHATPAVELRMPGGRAFPAAVRSGESATGVFVFNIPRADRSHVEVTVDTSVRNPVIAFTGAAPK
jgi:hypothetical protein